MAEEVIAVSHVGDVGTARLAAKRLAGAIGFDETACEEVALVASELAFNLIKHAHGGRLRLTALDDAARPGLQIESRDDGPGIADVERALTDGFSTGGGLGYGLGTVNRLLDMCEITSQPGQGAHIVGRRWLRPVVRAISPFPLAFGVATRPCPGFEVNGDAFVVKRWGECALAGVIDGLGHGPFAQRAALTARQFVESHHDRPLEEIFRGVGRACRATRGVVMALARFTVGSQAPPAPAIRLSFASIGNIEARALRAPEPIDLLVRRGVLGGVAPALRVTHHPWDPRGVLVLHSDGLTARWRWEDFPGLADQPAAAIAHRLLQALAKAEDDATVVAITGSGN